jgi:hypothetical protein
VNQAKYIGMDVHQATSFLTRSNFCKFRVSEFFNSHSSYHQQSQTEIASDNPLTMLASRFSLGCDRCGKEKYIVEGQTVCDECRSKRSKEKRRK